MEADLRDMFLFDFFSNVFQLDDFIMILFLWLLRPDECVCLCDCECIKKQRPYRLDCFEMLSE